MPDDVPTTGYATLGQRSDDERYLEDAYHLLTSPDGQPPVPQIVQQTGLGWLVHNFGGMGLADALRRWPESLTKLVSAGYIVTVSATWDFDVEQAGALFDEGLDEASKLLIEREGIPLNFADWNEQAAMMITGLIAPAPYFRQARDYVHEQPAFQRLSTLASVPREPRVMEAKVRRRHGELYARAATYAWNVGFALGVMEITRRISHDPGRTP